MGIINNYLKNLGLERCYIRASKNIVYFPEQEQAEISICIYSSKEARDANAIPIRTESFLVKNENVLVKEQIAPDYAYILSHTPLDKRIKVVEEPVYKTKVIFDEVTGDEIIEQTGEIEYYEKVQYNLTKEEIIENFPDKFIEITKGVEYKFFDEFKTFFEKGEYLKGIYNYLYAHPNIRIEQSEEI